ncbi:MAG: 2-dehydropantoate 2-reductase [Gemmatimonadetes bacterium]|nr:2-dehydropantoate 2-reductase [Gemmatimonadota bacterium]
MRVVVVGAGAVGGYFGGRLAEAGEDVVFFARGEHLDALRRTGLRVESPKGDLVLSKVQATDDVADVEAADLVLVCVKAWQVPDVATTIQPFVGPNTAVLPLQNGVEAADHLAVVLGRDRVLVGLCKILCMIVGPGHIRHMGVHPRVLLGEVDNRSSDRVRAIMGAFERARVAVENPPDVGVALWEKFLLIASLGGVGAVTRSSTGVIRSVPESRALLQEAMQEIAAVATARGHALPGDGVSRALKFIDAMPEGATASMQRDIMEGRPSELESQNGAVVRLGSAAGVDTPVHRFIHGALLPMEMAARG